MKRIRIVVASFAMAVAFVGSGSTAKAGSCGVGHPPLGNCLFYSGDFNGIEGLHNIFNGYSGSLNIDAVVYDNIIVPPGGWTVTSLFTNNIVYNGDHFLEVRWEIRTAVGTGNGGTLVASGTATGSNASFPNGQDQWWGTGETAEADGLNVYLAPGQYWISVTPVGGIGSSMSDESTTSGANCVNCTGHHQLGIAYFASPYWSRYFEPTKLECHIFLPCRNFSFGVAGWGGTGAT